MKQEKKGDEQQKCASPATGNERIHRDHVPRDGSIENPFFYFVVCLAFAREEIRRMGNGE
jgi:hypothetical protein